MDANHPGVERGYRSAIDGFNNGDGLIQVRQINNQWINKHYYKLNPGEFLK